MYIHSAGAEPEVEVFTLEEIASKYKTYLSM
jgi:hypothetical protein